MKSSCTGMGFSHHSVPSLSNTATLSSTGTALAVPSPQVCSTKLMMLAFVWPSFQLDNGSSENGSSENGSATWHLHDAMLSSEDHEDPNRWHHPAEMRCRGSARGAQPLHRVDAAPSHWEEWPCLSW